MRGAGRDVIGVGVGRCGAGWGVRPPACGAVDSRGWRASDGVGMRPGLAACQFTAALYSCSAPACHHCCESSISHPTPPLPPGAHAPHTGAQRDDELHGEDPGAARAPGSLRVRQDRHLRPAHEQARPEPAGHQQGAAPAPTTASAARVGPHAVATGCCPCPSPHLLSPRPPTCARHRCRRHRCCRCHRASPRTWTSTAPRQPTWSWPRR